MVEPTTESMAKVPDDQTQNGSGTPRGYQVGPEDQNVEESVRSHLDSHHNGKDRAFDQSSSKRLRELRYIRMLTKQ
jgi:hypothetical protein